LTTNEGEAELNVVLMDCPAAMPGHNVAAARAAHHMMVFVFMGGGRRIAVSTEKNQATRNCSRFCFFAFFVKRYNERFTMNLSIR
jgi:hypothetical protein